MGPHRRAGLAAVFLGSSCVWNGSGEFASTVQRGALSSDTATPPKGTFELEVGVSVDWQDAGDVPTALKWGATETVELFVGGSPYQWVDTDGVDEGGVGDPVVGGRWRFLELVPEHPAAALQLEAKLPLGDDDLSTGETDYLASFILDAAVGHVGVTGFYQVGALGEEGSSGFDVLHLVALGTGVPIHGALAGYGELVWSEIPEQDVEAGFVQAGVYYTASSSVVYDAGVSLGFGPDAPDVIFLIGLTKNLGRIFAR